MHFVVILSSRFALHVAVFATDFALFLHANLVSFTDNSHRIDDISGYFVYSLECELFVKIKTNTNRSRIKRLKNRYSEKSIYGKVLIELI